jgi:hypothetical protein
MNIQHSCRTDDWYTPLPVLTLVRGVLGNITLDPASSFIANGRVGAQIYYDAEENGLEQLWYGNVFCNPPGGKTGNRSNTGLFWEKLMKERSRIRHAIFLCFSIEAMQSTQRAAKSVGEFPFCIPARRIAFDKPDGTPGNAPSHSNLIVYVPGCIDKTPLFATTFGALGLVRA